MKKALKYIKKITKSDGRVYLYLRHPDIGRLIPLPSGLPLDSPQFIEAYQAALDFEETERLRLQNVLRLGVLRASERSRKSGRAFSIDLPFIMALAERQHFKCAVSGIPFQANPGKSRANPYRPSIDRLECSEGYIPGNVRLVLAAVNVGMSDFGESVYRKICTAVAERGGKNGFGTWETDLETGGNGLAGR